MDALVPQLIHILGGIWHGRWVGLAVAWLVGLAAAAYIFLTPDRYEATTRVFVDTQSILKPLLTGLTVQPNVEQEVEILSRTLISRPNLQKLVRMTDMDVNPSSAEDRERLIDVLMRTLYIRNGGRENLYIIGFSDPQPEQAKRVVESLLSIFVKGGLPARISDTGQAKRFIEDQLKAYEERLTEAENRVKEFKLQNMDPETPVGADFFASFSTLTDNLREARLKLQEAYRSRDALQQQLKDEEDRLWSSPQGHTAAIATPELDTRLNSLNKNLDELLLRYTDRHPDVLNARRMIKELEAQRVEERKRLSLEREARRRAAPHEGSGAVPVYPQLKLALAEAEAQVAALKTRVSDFERRYAQLRKQAESVPEREAQLAQLNRDYAIQKQNYEALVARRETAMISGDMEAATGVAEFRVIDPPRVSLNPMFPNRKILIPLALLASLCAGIAASYFFSMVYPTFHDKRSLKAIGQRPVLGAVSLIATQAVLAKRRRGAMLFFGGLGGLVASYSVAVAIVLVKSLFLL
jgi:polysaccharide chain length determinant protein (PEP-CTERM system associated)